VEPLTLMAYQLSELKTNGGQGALEAYIRNVKLGLYSEAGRVVLEVK
jgi:hypothetical protein